MAFNNDASNLIYHVFKDYNINFDEKANSFCSVRLAQWVKSGNEPDESKAKIEIRRITVKPEGEQPLKGISFSSPDAVSELADGLISVGFGNTRNILLSLSKRDDFKDTVENINIDPDDNGSEDGFFDMRSFLLGINNDEE